MNVCVQGEKSLSEELENRSSLLINLNAIIPIVPCIKLSTYKPTCSQYLLQLGFYPNMC